MRGVARFYRGLMRALGVFCGLVIGAMTVGIAVDVAMRNAKLGSIPWILEANEYGLYLMALLGAPWVLHRGAHVRVDVLVKSVPAAFGRWLEIAVDAIGLAGSAILVYYAVAVARAALRDNALVIKAFIFPEWWIFAAMALAAVLLASEFARRIVSALQGEISDSPMRPL